MIEKIKQKEMMLLSKYILILAIILIAIISITVMAQPSNLTDRELLIQLYGKTETIERMVNTISDNTYRIQKDISALDKRVTKNETNIDTFCKSIDGVVAKWNTLLAFFLTLLVGVIVTIIGKSIIKKVNV